jgi:hypothetical protein
MQKVQGKNQSEKLGRVVRRKRVVGKAKVPL